MDNKKKKEVPDNKKIDEYFKKKNIKETKQVTKSPITTINQKKKQ